MSDVSLWSVFLGVLSFAFAFFVTFITLIRRLNGHESQLIGVTNCKPGFPYDIHGDVVYGTGVMSDGSLCLRCGLNTYGRIWPCESSTDITNVTLEMQAQMEHAREIGIENN